MGLRAPLRRLGCSFVFSRTSLRLAGCVLAVVASLAASGCEEENPQKHPLTAADPAEQARLDQGKKLLAQANEALGEKQYDRARKLLHQAAELNNESQRFEIDEAQEKLDKRQAKLWANEVDDAFKSNDCAGAFKQLATPLKTLAESEAFTRELRRLVGADALKCAQGMVDEKIGQGAYSEGRALGASSAIVSVLGPSVAAKLATEVEATIAEGLAVRISGDIKARRWSAVADKIDAVAKSGDATEEQVETLLTTAREAAAAELDAIATRAIGQRDAAAALKQVEQTAKALRWAIPDPSVSVQTSATLPPQLAKKHYALAVWVETQHLALRPLTKPEARFTHGKVQVFPAASADAPSKQDLPHGTKIWILGSSKGKALVSATDPAGASLVQMLDKVTGWVAENRLAKENTADWLVPDDQLKGERVWGPLRAPDPMWELGVVMDVSGKDITVQRLADGVNQKLPRQKLRSGRLSPGTRVITFCVAKDQPAQIVEVPPTQRSAKLKCDSGQEKEEDLASLRSKPELLPATR